MISLYFHIPFCSKKCPYCHFYVVPNRESFKQVLLEGLRLEWERQQPLIDGKEIVSIYFGGGTPALFPEGIREVLSWIQPKSGCEITVEANPEESSVELFEHLKNSGVNRLSIGVQSLDDRSLQTLERLHNAQKAKDAIKAAEIFGNVSIDLMYDLPGQTEESWRYSLDQLESLQIHHLSLYNLTIEPHTAFHKRGVKAENGEKSVKFYQAAIEKFEKIGLERYEISAFAKGKEYQSRHNLGYWTGRPFLGFGPSAFSFWEGERFRNIANLNRYTSLLKSGESPVDFREKLEHPANVKELLAVRLRLKGGVDLRSFPPLPAETRITIEKLIESGLLIEKETLQMTDSGLLLYDSIASEII